MAGSKAPDHQLRINDQGELTSQAVAGPAVEPHPQAILPSDDPEAVIPFIQLQRSLAVLCAQSRSWWASRRGRELIINGHPNSRVDQSAGSEVFRVPSAQIAAAQSVRDN